MDFNHDIQHARHLVPPRDFDFLFICGQAHFPQTGCMQYFNLPALFRQGVLHKKGLRRSNNFYRSHICSVLFKMTQKHVIQAETLIFMTMRKLLHTPSNNAQWHAKVGLPFFYTPCIISETPKLKKKIIKQVKTNQSCTVTCSTQNLKP